MKNENLFAKGFKSGFKNFGYNITSAVNFILLVPVYLIGVGLTSVMAKLSRKRFLDLKLKGKTYWKERKLEKEPLEKYYRQF